MDCETAAALADRLWGLTVTAVSELPSYDDRNFKLTTSGAGPTCILRDQRAAAFPHWKFDGECQRPTGLKSTKPGSESDPRIAQMAREGLSPS